jgi:dihydrofolate synthase/folylpolyglutamate synthase
MQYTEAVRYIESFWKFGIKLGLDRIRYLLNGLNDPQDDLRTVHVAGTNGKGSTCAMIASILKESGLKVGLYTSPHLIDYTERISVKGQGARGKIEKHVFAKYVGRIKAIIDDYPKAREKPTEFEILTAFAVKYFADQGVDIAVIETGLGGRLDSTNVIMPEVCAITNIDLDHTEILGKDIESIAKEKAGIIKPGVSVVVPASLNKKALKVIRSICKEKKSPLFIAPKAAQSVKLKGFFQKENAGVALGVIKELRSKGFKITDKNIIDGLKKTNWSARFQIVRKRPLVIVDAGHNPAGIKAIAREAGKNKKATFVLGMLNYKDYIGAVKAAAPFAKRIIASAIKHPKSLDPKLISKEARRLGVESSSFDELDCALEFVLETSSKDDIICIAGSHVTAGEAITFFG